MSSPSASIVRKPSDDSCTHATSCPVARKIAATALAAFAVCPTSPAITPDETVA